MAKFPKQIFVTAAQFSDGSGNWFAAHENEIDAVKSEDSVDDKVATYQLVKVNRLKLNESVEIVTDKQKS